MTDTALAAQLRDTILSDPDLILEDRDLMRVLIAANDGALGGNVVDLRGIAMARLETRLDRLEDAHRTVIAAAYENLAGTNQIHRAVLRLLEAADFAEFLGVLGGELGEILRVESVRLVLETAQEGEAAALGRFGDVLCLAEPGFVQAYMKTGRSGTNRAVTLRQVQPLSPGLYGPAADWVRSEALMRLDLGPGRLPGMLAMGAEDPHHFKPSHGTDLLAFFAGTFERAMRRWLS